MRRFFFNTAQRQGELVTLDIEESHHISKVLRLKQGEAVELCERSGRVFSAEIVKTGKNVLVALLKEKSDVQQNTAKLFIGQGAIKNKNMELILQKCTELGVDDFHPYVSGRSQGNIVQQYQGKGDRWRRIIDEACKQSLRPYPMKLHTLSPFVETISLMKGEESVLKLLLWEKEKQAGFADYSDELKKSKAVCLLLGPEGGFTQKEVEEARLLGWQTIGMGKRILRAETAAIAAISIVQHYRGCM